MIYGMVVDELLELWEGVACRDSSKRDEQFTLRAMMVTGCMDYPALTDACCQGNEGSYGGCVKCTEQGAYVKAIEHMKYARHLHTRGCTHAEAEIPVMRHTHESLVDRADKVEVRNSNISNGSIVSVTVTNEWSNQSSQS
jgi:hypothetical protein